VEEQILREPRFSGTYQIVITRDGHLDNVEIRCELQPGPSASPPEVAEMGKALQHRIKTLIGISTRVSVMDFGTLPRTQTGKARRVWDERPQQV
jgi:phenylacetate-CoA ligase